MKKTLLFLFLVSSLLALGSNNSSTNNYNNNQKHVYTFSQEKLFSLIKTKLNLPLTLSSDTKEKIMSTFKYYFKKDHYYFTYGTDILASSIQPRVRFLEVNMVDNQGVANFLFIYYPDQRKMYISRKDIVSGAVSVIEKKYMKQKAKSDFIVKKDTKQYAYLANTKYPADDIFSLQKETGSSVQFDAFTITIR